MDKRDCYEISITVYSYKDVVDEFRRKNNLNNAEVIEMLANELQMRAWGDAYTDMQASIDWENSPEGKKFIAEQEKRK